MVNVAKLKPRSARKGTPPPPDITNSNLKTSPREKPERKAKIEFSVPEHILDDFAKKAGERFGFRKGSKSDLFIAIWNEYQERLTG